MSRNALVFSGDLGLQDMADAHVRLRAALTAREPISVDLSSVTDAPLAFVQLIEAAARDAEKHDVSMKLSGLAPALRAMLQRAGFLESSAVVSAFWRSDAA